MLGSSHPASDSNPTTAPLILLVEDDKEIANMLRRFLQLEGFSVQWHDTGCAGLETAKSSRPGAIILDLNLPDMDGCKMLHVLKSAPETTAIPVIVASAATHRLNLDERRLAHAVMAKPFAFGQLLTALEAAGLRGAAGGPQAVSRL